eukprot:3138646-Rhodomonas_salina.3
MGGRRRERQRRKRGFERRRKGERRSRRERQVVLAHSFRLRSVPASRRSVPIYPEVSTSLARKIWRRRIPVFANDRAGLVWLHVLSWYQHARLQYQSDFSTSRITPCFRTQSITHSLTLAALSAKSKAIPCCSDTNTTGQPTRSSESISPLAALQLNQSRAHPA